MPAKLSLPLLFLRLSLSLGLVCAHVTAFGQVPESASSPPSDSAVTDAVQQMKAAGVKTFSTKDHPKAHGLDISFQYPASWASLEVDLPDTIQDFGPGDEAGFIISLTASVLRSPGGGAPTRAEISDLLTRDGLMRRRTASSTFISGQSTELGGQHAYELLSSSKEKMAGADVTCLVVSLFFVRQNVLVEFGGSAWGASNGERSRHAQELRLMLHAMARTILIQGDGHNPRPVSDAPTSAPPPAAAAPAPPPALTERALRAAFPDSRAPLTQTFTTVGNPKARGIGLSLRYPAGWQAKADRSETIIQTFSFPGTQDLVTLHFVPAAADAQAELDAALDVYDFAKLMREDDQFMDGVVVTLHGRRAAMVTSSFALRMGPGREHQMIQIRYTLAHGSTQVRLICNVSTSDPAHFHLLPAHLEEMKPLFQSIAESIVFDNGTATMAPAPASSFTEPSTLSTTEPSTATAPSTSASRPPLLGATFSLVQDFLLTILVLTLVGTGLPILFFLKKDRQLGRYYTLGRIAYVIMIAAVLGLMILTGTLISVAGFLSPEGAILGMVIPLAYVSMRRMVDVGWSRWSILLGLLGLWPPLFPFSLLVDLIFMFVPGKARPSASLPPHAPPIPDAKANTSLNPKDTPLRPRPLHAPVTTTATTAENDPAADPAAHTPAEPRVPARAIRRAQPQPQPAHTADTPSTSITLWQGGETYGPYAVQDIITMWDAGQLAGNASYWHAGLPEYRPLAQDVDHLRAMT